MKFLSSRTLGVLLCAALVGAPACAWPASALLTAGTRELDAYTASAATGSITLFTMTSGTGRRLLASVDDTLRERPVVVRWHGPSADAGLNGAERDLATLERLYEYVLRLDPARTFEFRLISPLTGDDKPAARTGPDQGDVLRAIARARQRAAADLAAGGSTLKPVAWGIATIEVLPPPTGQKPDPDVVRVRVRDERQQPIAGVTLTASRGAEAICPARSDKDGIASCRLIDAHAHEGGDEDHGAATIVTFPGVVSSGRIEVPTTLAIR